MAHGLFDLLAPYDENSKNNDQSRSSIDNFWPTESASISETFCGKEDKSCRSIEFVELNITGLREDKFWWILGVKGLSTEIGEVSLKIGVELVTEFNGFVMFTSS